MNDVAPANQDQPFFPIVGIGASAGGLEALEQFFDNMPVDTGMAFVVVQHLSPDFKSLMDELLARHTTMDIHRVIDGVEVKPDSIYLIPPKTNMMLSEGKLRLTEHLSTDGLRYPIDIFFESLSKDAGERAIAVVLSGTGSDGSRGIQRIHESAGLVLAQDTRSAGFDGMPRSAAATGIADVIGPASQLPEKILEYLKSPASFERGQIVGEETNASSGRPADIMHLFRVFRKEYGIDFSMYKANTVNRRVKRRMQLEGFEEIESLISELENDHSLLETLYRDLLVEVTHFFRDKKAFQILDEKVFPELISRTQERDEIRVWVPGCATGEEAYSIAILLREAALRLGRDPVIKVFASDVHQSSLDIAGAGVYSASALEDVPEYLQDKYFLPDGDGFRVDSELRQMVVFARHDITVDPPFTKIDFLSCRNVLIYLEQEVQKRIIAMFHFSLKQNGVLFLGPSETTGDYSKEFVVLDSTWRVFRKLRSVRLPEVGRIPLAAPALAPVVIPGSRSARESSTEESWLLPAAYEKLLERYVPPSLLINEFHDIVHTFGEARRLLVQPAGKPSLNLMKMVEGQMKSALSAGLHQAERKKTPVSFSSVEADTLDGKKIFNVIVEPSHKGTQKLFLVTFEEQERLDPGVQVPDDVLKLDSKIHDRTQELERELDYTRESLQATVEELETSNEELQSTNEELVASNEELQSTNEELHSVNEELHTVNAEHQRKISELTQTNNDLNNFVSSTETGTIFLDQEMRIRRFTPAISRIFKVLEQDVGRPIEHFAHSLDSPNLIQDLKVVLESGESVTREISGPDHQVFFERIQPYANSYGEVEGAVLSFTDISKVRMIEGDLDEVRETLSDTTADYQEFAYAVSHDLQAPLRHIEAFCEMLVTDDEIQGGVKESVDGIQASAQHLKAMFNSLLDYSRIESRGEEFQKFSLEQLLDEVVSDHKTELDSCGAELTVESLPNLKADRGQIRQLLWHLIDNCIKYRAERDLRIHISASRVEDSCLIKIDDNGIGVEPRHLERMFVMFQRLGVKQDVPGRGVGLAMCARIVARHSGAIWCESTFGEGATVCVRLPSRDA